MKKLLIIISFIAVSITGVKAQLFMQIGPSDSLTVVGYSIGQSGLNVGIKDSLNPDIYIDGIKYNSKILDIINPEKIESMEVIKGEAAIKEYNAPNGAILITSKAAAKLDKPNIRLRATGNFNSLDKAIAVHRLSDEELKKLEADGKIRIRATGKIDSLDKAIAIHRLSDEELKKIEVVDAKDRATGIERFENPVIVIDGKVVAYDELSKISPSEIESIEVKKDEKTMEQYNAPNGVIVVKTKKKKE